MSAKDGKLRLDAFLPYRLSVASNAASKRVAQIYAEQFGISIPEWRLIAVLSEIGDATQQDLVSRTVMDKVAVSRAALKLEQRRLIRRDTDSADGRAHRVTLTARGEALYAAIAPAALAQEAELLAAFRPDEIALLHTLLRRIERAASAEQDEEAGVPGAK